MLWVMVWLVCTTGGCYESRVEQEFRERSDCQYALDYYRDNHGVIGICTVQLEDED